VTQARRWLFADQLGPHFLDRPPDAPPEAGPDRLEDLDALIEQEKARRRP
jgi:hypothetical protein